jgi:hypothetical protein
MDDQENSHLQYQLTSTGLGVGFAFIIFVGEVVDNGGFVSIQVLTSFLTSTCFIIILSLLPELFPDLPPLLLLLPLLPPDLLDLDE